MSQSKLSTSLTLSQYQTMVQELVEERGFTNETVSEVFTVLIEEIGELAKAIRHHNGQKMAKGYKDQNVSDEAADVFCLLLDICNRLKIDLGKAFYDKELKNQKRTWQ